MSFFLLQSSDDEKMFEMVLFSDFFRNFALRKTCETAHAASHVE
jgi:hypothetical protein